MKNLFIFLRSFIYAPFFILFFGWIAQNVRIYDTRFGLTLPLWMRIPGVLFMVAGSALILFCIIVFIVHGKGTPAPFDPPREFVPTGPYRFVRNPMYIGGFILLFGFGLFHYSVSILVLMVVLFIPFHLFVLFYEEPVLEQQFGSSYLKYKKRTPRWIPKWKH